MRLLFTLQYLGTRYAGWQRQANAVAVQQVVEQALGKMFGASIHVEGAGRTDSGVHARAQRAHADVPFEIGERGLLLGLNDLLPHDIRITAVEIYVSGHMKATTTETTRPANIGPMIQER